MAATEVASLMVTIGGDVSGLKGALKSADQKIGNFGANAGRAFADFGRNLVGLGAATLPLTAALGGGIRVAADFESAMTEIGARTGITGAELQKIGDFALDMGAKTVFSGQQAADALLQIMTSGANAEEAMQLLPTVMEAAAASGEDLGTTADTLTDIMAAFSLSIKDAPMVVDALAQAAGASSADMASLGQGFANVGGVAKSFGLSVEDTAATLAIFSENGIKGAEAGTQLKSMLLNMTATTDKTKAAWGKLGTSFYDAQGNARPLEEIIGSLDYALDRLPVEEQNELMKQLGGSYGIVGLNALRGSISIDEMRKRMKSSAKAGTVADAKMQTFAVTMDSLQGSVETLMIRGLTPLMQDTLKPLVKDITTVVNAVSAWIQRNPTLASNIARVAFGVSLFGTAILAAIPAVFVIGTALALLTSPITLVVAGFAALVAVGPEVLAFFGQLAGAVGAAIAGIQIGETTVGQIASNIGASINAIHIGNTTFGVLAQNVGWAIEAALSGIVINVSSLTELPGRILGAINDAFSGGVGSTTVIADALAPGFGTGMGAAIVSQIPDDIFTPLATKIGLMIDEALYGIVIDFSALSRLPENINTILTDTFSSWTPTGITEIPQKIGDAIRDSFSGGFDLTGISTWAESNINTILNTVVSVAGIILGGPIGLAIGAAKLISGAIESDFLGIGTFLQESGIAASVETAFNQLKATIEGIISSVFGGGGENPMAAELAQWMPTEADMGGAGGAGALGKFGADLARGVDAIKGILAGVTPGIAEGLVELGNGVRRFIDGIMSADFSGLYDAVRPVLGVIGGLISAGIALSGFAIGAVLEGLGSALGPLGEGIGSLISAVSSLGQGDLGGFLTNLGTGLLKLVEGVTAFPISIADSVIQKLNELFGLQIPNMGDLWAQLVGAFESGWQSLVIITDNIKRSIDVFASSIIFKILDFIGTLQDQVYTATRGALDLGLQVNQIRFDLQDHIGFVEAADQITATLQTQLANGDIDLSQAFNFTSSSGTSFGLDLAANLFNPGVIASMGEAGKLAVKEALALAFGTGDTAALEVLIPLAAQLGLNVEDIKTQATTQTVTAVEAITPQAQVGITVISNVISDVAGQVSTFLGGLPYTATATASIFINPLVQFTQSIQSIIANMISGMSVDGGGGGADVPGHRYGSDYTAEGLAYLHEGERVLTRQENREFGRGGMAPAGGVTYVINQPLGNGYQLIEQLRRVGHNGGRGR